MITLFNDIYEDGTNETQSLLCVTVLGSLGNDKEMLAKAEEFMSDPLKKRCCTSTSTSTPARAKAS